MKSIFSLLLCFLLLFPLVINASAESGEGTVIYSEETVLEDGLTAVDEVILYDESARSIERTAERKRSIYRDDVLIGVVAFKATFRFDGDNVSVVSKSVTQSDTYDGWSYKQTTFLSDGGTVTLSGKLTKLLIFNVPFTMSMTCDANGNITIA